MTVRSSGPVAEMYPESLGQYNIIRDVFRNDHPVYKHVDRDDRFIVYSGNIEATLFDNVIFTIYLSLDYWYITQGIDMTVGDIRNVQHGGTLVPPQDWQYRVRSCKTAR